MTTTTTTTETTTEETSTMTITDTPTYFHETETEGRAVWRMAAAALSDCDQTIYGQTIRRTEDAYRGTPYSGSREGLLLTLDGVAMLVRPSAICTLTVR